jgi:predicted alpha/beta superfamily hydrolase
MKTATNHIRNCWWKDTKTIFEMKKMLFYLLVLFISEKLYSQKEITDICIGKTFLFASKILNEQRRIFIYLPGDYSKASYPVLYLITSGSYDFRLSIFHNQFIIIGIESHDSKRDFLKAINRDNFCMFLEKELIPYIEVNYKTLPIRFISGHSLSGGFIMDVFLKKPQLFSFYIATSPTLNVLDSIKTAEIKLEKETGLYFSIGDRENYEQLEKANSDFSAKLKSLKINHLSWKFEKLEGETHETNEFTGFCRAYNYYKSLSTVPDSILCKSIQEIIDYAKKMQLEFGNEIKIDGDVVMSNILINFKSKNYNNVVNTISYTANELNSFFIEEINNMLEIGNELQRRYQSELALQVFRTIFKKTKNQIAEGKIRELEKMKK